MSVSPVTPSAKVVIAICKEGSVNSDSLLCIEALCMSQFPASVRLSSVTQASLGTTFYNRT